MNNYWLVAKSTLLCVITALSFGFFKLNAQSHTPKNITINSNCNGYYEYLPSNYNSSSNKFPLLIYSGGAGSFGNGSTSQLSRLLTEGVPYYINRNQFPASFTANGQTSSFIVISPQFKAWPSPTDIEAVLNFVINSGYKVDQSRIYLSGFSAGGDVAWKFPNTSQSRANRLAALVPVAGYNYPYLDTGAKYIAASNLPVWALHSNDDGPAPAYWSQNFVTKINSYNPATRAKITRFNGVTHDNTKLHVYNPSFKDGGLNIYEWMLQYRRNYPPVARAGDNQTIVLPNNATTLDASQSYDPENGGLNYRWKMLNGPSQYSLTNATSQSATLSNLVSGDYYVQLEVIDNYGLQNFDTVQIIVKKSVPNVAPTARAGSSITLALPDNTIYLDGSASFDEDGSIESYSWKKVGGPAQFYLENANSAKPKVSNLNKGVYQFELTVTDNDGAEGKGLVEITVYNPNPNQVPVANAGDDITVTLPLDDLNLTGSRSADPDGEIIAYKWTQVSGPNTVSFSNYQAANTSISNLAEGTYQFQLTVTDNEEASSSDMLEVVVLSAPLVQNKYIKINLFAGANPYNQDGWNNWNVSGETNINSSIFKYSNGTQSSVKALLSYSQGVPDNGANYGGNMCPPQVLRYTTYSTAATRSLTISGLNNNYFYDIELYASRLTTGNSTQFVINGQSRTVSTDYNLTDKAVFSNIKPQNGQIVVAINKIGTFSYLNGLIITEKGNNTPLNSMAQQTKKEPEMLVTPTKGQLLVLPNPFNDKLQITFSNTYRGNVQVSLVSAEGRKVKQAQMNKSADQFYGTLLVQDLPRGIYYLIVQEGKNVSTTPLFKH